MFWLAYFWFKAVPFAFPVEKSTPTPLVALLTNIKYAHSHYTTISERVLASLPRILRIYLTIRFRSHIQRARVSVCQPNMLLHSTHTNTTEMAYKWWLLLAPWCYIRLRRVIPRSMTVGNMRASLVGFLQSEPSVRLPLLLICYTLFSPTPLPPTQPPLATVTAHQ